MNMFKKSLLAASVAGLATAAVAGTINSTKVNYSLEGTAAMSTVAIGTELNASITTGKNYIENDILVISVTGAPIDVANSSPSLGVPADFSFVKAEGTNLLFRVENQAGITTGSTYTLSGVDLDVSNVSAGTTVSVSSYVDAFNAVVGEYDQSKAVEIAEYVQQYTFEGFLGNDTLNAKIDTALSRTGFETGGSTSVGFDFANDVDGLGLTGAYTADTATHVISASTMLSYLAAFDANEDGELSNAEVGSAFAFSGDDSFSVELSTDMTELTITQEASAGLDLDPTIYFFAPYAANSAQVIEETSFSASVDFTDGTASTDVVTDAGIGAWTLNGANIFVPYMPYGAGISQVLYVTNDSTQTGDIEVTAFDEAGNEYGPWVVGESGAKSITKITGLVNQRLYDAGFTSGKVALDIVVNAPAGQVDVTSSYNVRGNRVSVNNR